MNKKTIIIICLLMVVCALISSCAAGGEQGEYRIDSTYLERSVTTEDNYRVFYEIFVGSFSDSDGDGTGDVYLIPCYRNDDRIYGYEMDIYCIKNVELFEGIEDDIRYRYYAWLSSAAKIRTGFTGDTDKRRKREEEP